MPAFSLTLDIPFTDQELGSGLEFCEFLPRAKDAITFKSEQYDLKLYFSYDRKHLNHVNNDFLKSQKDIKKWRSISVNALRLDITTEIGTELYDQLGNDKLNTETEAFCKEVMNVAVETYNTIFDFARNILKQSWLQHVSYPAHNYGDFFLHTNSVWEYKGQRKRLYLEGYVSEFSVVVNMNKDPSHIDRRNWKALAKHIESGKKPKTQDVFLSNSLEHLESKKTRMAIIEAVIALEHVVKDDGCKNLKPFLPAQEFNCVKRLITKKNQFSIPLELFLIKNEKKIAKRGISKDEVLSAVEFRNNIMHNSQKEINYAKARRCITNVKKLVALIAEQ